MMTDKDVPNAAAPGPQDPEAVNPEAAGADAAGKAHHPRPHEHFVSPGAESTRELREMARRRREAEEKLQQHLQEAHHLHEAKEKPAEDQGGH
ncbi:hypothetical protein [Arthrobacter sp. C9C5]|uniref:hypothetical protein n=1 Tax=Arthrobacter sp. C9C5 TaxID=2735267 RepID=UPI00182888C9|nr:hypothetical protein [Arthrobacter sp. C9C5]NUU31744.1 hypothetical protein [Arthrobacter sp. C9C5]